MFATLSTKKPRLIFYKIGVVAVPNKTPAEAFTPPADEK